MLPPRKEEKAVSSRSSDIGAEPEAYSSTGSGAMEHLRQLHQWELWRELASKAAIEERGGLVERAGERDLVVGVGDDDEDPRSASPSVAQVVRPYGREACRRREEQGPDEET